MSDYKRGLLGLGGGMLSTILGKHGLALYVTFVQLNFHLIFIIVMPNILQKKMELK